MPYDPLQELYTKEEQLDKLIDSEFTEEEIAWLKDNMEELRREVFDVQAENHLTQVKNVAEMMLHQERQARLNTLDPLLPSRNFEIIAKTLSKFHGIPLPQAHHTESDTGVMYPIYEKKCAI